MPSFGENLRREREKRNITLEQISLSTKIGTRMLQALEENKFTQLPGGIFNKGFVRAYARHLGLDEDQTVADYLEASGDAPTAMPEIAVQEEAPRRIEAREEKPTRPLPWGLFAALLLLAALVLSLWSHRQKKQETTAVAPSSTAATQPPPAVGGGGVGTGSMGTGSVGTGSEGTGDLARPAARGAASPPTPSPGSRAKSPQPATAEPKPTASPQPAAPSGPSLTIQAAEDSWTTVTSDGQTLFSGTLVAGDQRTYRVGKELVVHAGNVGGITFLFNGKKLDRQGESGQVRTLAFGPAGLLPGAASAPKPPAATPPPQ